MVQSSEREGVVKRNKAMAFWTEYLCKYFRIFYQNFAEKNDKSSYLKVPMLQFSIFNCNAFRSGFIEAVMISRNVLKGSEFNCLIRSESGFIILILIGEQTGEISKFWTGTEGHMCRGCRPEPWALYRRFPWAQIKYADLFFSVE